MSYILVNYKECRGCNCCTLACSFFNNETFNLSKANVKIACSSNTGMTFPVVCQHCHDAVCIEICPEEAIHRDKKTGAVVIDQALCVGCEMCISECPIESPRIDVENSVAVKCDLCGGDPKCVKYCGYGALRFIEGENSLMESTHDYFEKYLKY